MTAQLALNGCLVDASAFGSDEHPETPVYHPETEARGGLGGSMGSALAGLDGTSAELHYNIIVTRSKPFEAGRGAEASVEPVTVECGPHEGRFRVVRGGYFISIL